MRDRFLRVMVLGVLASACWASAAAAATGPALVGSASNSTTLSGANAVAVSGHYAYEVSYWSGQLNVLDISNPAAPTIVGSTPAPPSTGGSMSSATNVTISSHFAFVTSKNRNTLTGNDDGSGDSLTIVDITTPTAPSVMGTVHAPSGNGNILFGAYSVAVSGNFAYVASQGNLSAQGEPAGPLTSSGSFSVIDITNPSGPTLAGNIDNSSLTGAFDHGLDHATSVAISGHYAFVTAFNSNRLTTIDISTPSAPVVVHTLADATSFPAANDVVINGGYAYVVNQTNTGLELAAVNISNPLAPTVVSTLSDPSLLGSYRVRTRGNFIYVSANSAASIAAIDVSHPNAPRLVGSVKDTTDLANVTGLDVSSTGRYIIATSPRRTNDAHPAIPPYPFQTGGPVVTGTVSVIDLAPSPISVTIAPASEPAKLTASTSAAFSFATNDAVATVQCSLDQAALAACTSPTTATYSSLKAGTHTFTVQATDATGATAQASYGWTVTAVTAVPAPTGLPKISGIAQQGKTLSSSAGTWSGAPTFSYQWQRCTAKGTSCKSIAKQTSTTYKATVTDVGSRLEIVVTGKNSVGSASARSLATNVVKWSSGSFASAKLTHSKSSTPGLSLSVPSVGAGLLLQRLAIAGPKGLSFHGSRSALAKGLVVKSRSGKKLAFKLSLKHGTLTLTLTKPSTGVTVTLARGQVSKFKSKSKSPKLTVSLSYRGKPVRRGGVKLRLG